MNQIEPKELSREELAAFKERGKKYYVHQDDSDKNAVYVSIEFAGYTQVVATFRPIIKYGETNIQETLDSANEFAKLPALLGHIAYLEKQLKIENDVEA